MHRGSVRRFFQITTSLIVVIGYPITAIRLALPRSILDHGLGPVKTWDYIYDFLNY